MSNRAMDYLVGFSIALGLLGTALGFGRPEPIYREIYIEKNLYGGYEYTYEHRGIVTSVTLKTEQELNQLRTYLDLKGKVKYVE